MGEARAECRTFYPVLCAPSGAQRNESAVWFEPEGEKVEKKPDYPAYLKRGTSLPLTLTFSRNIDFGLTHKAFLPNSSES